MTNSGEMRRYAGDAGPRPFRLAEGPQGRGEWSDSLFAGQDGSIPQQRAAYGVRRESEREE